MYDHYFSCCGRPHVPDNLCKASLVLEEKIFKGFTIYGYGSHLGQWISTILAIFHSPALVRLQMKFEQHWPRSSRGEVV